MTVVRVEAGICGFVTRITATKVDRRGVRIEMASDCKAVRALGARMQTLGALDMTDILSKGMGKNAVFAECSELLSHAACPVPSAIIKAAEVELGLALPKPVVIEFELVPEKVEAVGRSGAE